MHKAGEPTSPSEDGAWERIASEQPEPCRAGTAAADLAEFAVGAVSPTCSTDGAHRRPVVLCTNALRV